MTPHLTSEDPQRSRRTIPWLVPVLLGILVFEVGVLASRTVPHRSRRAETETTSQAGHLRANALITEWRRGNYDRSLEPHLGDPFGSARLTDVSGKPINPARFTGRPLALVFVEDVRSCTTRSLLAAWGQVSKRSRSLVVTVVVKDSSGVYEVGCQPLPESLLVVCDRTGRLASGLNAGWQPRAYAYDARHRLV